MNSPFGWFLPTVAVVFTAVAIWADDNFTLAVPAAVVAVLAAGLAFAEAVVDRSRAAGPYGGTAAPKEAGTVRTAFQSGRLGREAILDLLDRIERDGPNPNLPARRTDETNHLVRIPSTEFRHYVRERLDDLESRS